MSIPEAQKNTCEEVASWRDDLEDAALAMPDNSPDPWYPLERTSFQSLSSNLHAHSHNPKNTVFKNENLFKPEQFPK